MCIAAGLVQYNRWADTIRNVNEELVFPKLSDQLETIAKIKIERSISDTRGSFVIEPFDNKWGIIQKGGYQTRDGIIRETLIGLSQLTYQEAKTQDPDRYSKLKLRDITKKGSEATRLVIEDNQGRIILDALFGKRLQNLSGGTPSIYMRKTNEPQSWLTKGELEIRNGVLDWLSVILTSIQRERIKRVLITSRDGNELKLTYDTTFERFEIENLPNDREIKSRFQLLNIGIIPENLLLQDVRPARLKVDPELGGARWETKDGLIINLSLAADTTTKNLWAAISVTIRNNDSEKVKKEAIDFKTALATIGRFTIKKQVGEDGVLFGTVTNGDVAEAIEAATKKDIDRRDITVPDIHNLGSFVAKIKLHQEVSAEVNIEVTS